MLKNREQIKDLMCPICKDKKIIIHTIVDGDRWRAQCENHTFACHFKSHWFKSQEGAIQEIHKFIKNFRLEDWTWI